MSIHIINDDILQQVPTIDLFLLSQDSQSKSMVLKKLHHACQNNGIFHVINHGISEEVIEEAIEVNKSFFDGIRMKKFVSEVTSGDLLSPVMLVTLQRQAQGQGQLQRDILRLHAHPLEDFIESWPANPSHYREQMSRYSIQVRELAIELFEAIMESLNLAATTFKHLQEDFRKGVHTLNINNYPSRESKDIKTGAPPHSDYSIITILLQSSSGLQVTDGAADGTWKYVSAVPEKGALQVFVGDHLELLSNGCFKSVLHRVIPRDTENSRLSIASFHSFELDKVVEPAEELVDKEQLKRFEGCSLRDFLNSIHSRQPNRLIETLRREEHELEIPSRIT